MTAGLLGASCSRDIADGSPTTLVAPTTTLSDAPTTTVSAPTTTGATAAQPDIVGTALTSGMFTELAGLVADAGLIPTLRGGPFTVFAPTDAAFAKLPTDVLHAVQDDPKTLARVLTYHVVAGALAVADLQEGELETVSGDMLTITKHDGTTFVNGNAITTPDVAASNGVIHVMSDVLVPPLGDIVDVATALPDFTTLAKLVTAAKLVDTLRGDGPFTVFAPVDAAFAALPKATLDAVLADPVLLAAELTYHVVAGKLSTADLVDGKLETVAGVDLTVSHDKDGNVLIDGNPIAVANVEATNGIIQVMGAVLVPQS